MNGSLGIALADNKTLYLPGMNVYILIGEEAAIGVLTESVVVSQGQGIIQLRKIRKHPTEPAVEYVFHIRLAGPDTPLVMRRVAVITLPDLHVSHASRQ